jgi:hypothetical protein
MSELVRDGPAADAGRAAAEARLAKVAAWLKKADAHATPELVVTLRKGEAAKPTVRLATSLEAFEARRWR